MKVATLVLMSLSLLLLGGCGSGTEDSGDIATKAPIANDSPEAKNAPAAGPPNPDVPPPGGGIKGGRR